MELARISIEHDGSVRDRVDSIAAKRASVSAEGRAALDEHLASTKAAIGALAPNRPVIVSAMVLANADGLQRLGQDPAVERVETITRTAARGLSHHGLASPMNELSSGYVPSEGWSSFSPRLKAVATYNRRSSGTQGGLSISARFRRILRATKRISSPAPTTGPTSIPVRPSRSLT